MVYTPYVVPYALAAVVLTLMLPIALKRRLAGGTTVFALLAVACTAWCVGNALEVAAVTLQAKSLLIKLQYIPLMCVPPLWLVFALQYTGRLRGTARWWIALLAVVPVVTWVLLWVEGHQWMRYDEYLEPGTPFVSASRGPWYYVVVTSNYLQLGIGAVVLLISTARANRLYRAQGQLLFLSCLVVLSANVLHVLRLDPWPQFDMTAPAFAAAVALLTVAVFRYRMLDLVPAARETVIETMPDALLVIDHAGRVIDANPAAARLFGAGGRPLVGREIDGLLPSADWESLAHHSAGSLHHVLEMPDLGLLMELRLTPLRDDAVLSGWLAVFHDVTERETLVRQLRRALAEVNTLSGLIPICASCKKVRNDDGYWQQVEAYVSAHSRAEFTHSICPECAARLYPEAVIRDGDEDQLAPG